MPLEHQKWITRADLKANPDKLYVFGDNLAEVGYGGQAREMRGELNAYGIATKRDPGTCFTDADYADVVGIWGLDFLFLSSLLLEGKVVVIPADGIGTGLAALPTKAPLLYRRLNLFFNGLNMDAQYARNH